MMFIFGVFVAAFCYLMASFVVEDAFAVCIVPGQEYVSYESIPGGYCTPDPPEDAP